MNKGLTIAGAVVLLLSLIGVVVGLSLIHI